MSDMAVHVSWLDAISRRVREREVNRRVLYGRIRAAGIREYVGNYVADSIPVLLPELLKMMMGSLIGFWVIGKLLTYIFHTNPSYTFCVLALVYSVQATYYKHRLTANPSYKIPKCSCASGRKDNTEAVLRSRESAILGIPNSVLGTALYSALLLLLHGKHVETAMLVAIVTVLVSAYLGYVMVAKIGDLCTNCINIGALNFLILWRLLH
jgi:uncharacterized membrane protein